MASKGFTKNSSGKTFEEKSSGVTDLSDQATGSILGGSSMVGGNMISGKSTSLQTPTPGSDSEQTSTNILGQSFDANNVPDIAAVPEKKMRKETH